MEVDGQNTNSNPSDQEDVVALALEGYKADENGKVVIPENTPVFVATALKVEQRRRNANSAYSKSEAERLKLKSENEALRAGMADVAKPAGFSAVQQEELDELKFSDVDAYYERRQAFEKANKGAASEVVADAITAAGRTAEVNYNQQVAKGRDEAVNDMLTRHNVENPETPISKEMLELDIPPALMNRYTSGELGGPGFLKEVSKFLYADRVVGGKHDVGNEPDFSGATGSSSASDKAKEQTFEEAYASL